MTKIEKSPGCIQACLDVMGDKWTALIVRDLTAHKATFSELETSLVGISPRTLSQRLDKLVAEEIVEKCLYCERPPRNTYSLTKKGQELQEILVKMSDWGARHNRYQHIA
jgi:DNA-binding HxlR family transcriptional regulator